MDATTIDAAAAHRDNDIVQWLTSGTRDLYLSNTVRMHRKLREAGVEAELQVWEGQSHLQFMADIAAPETKEYHEEVTRFFDQHLGGNGKADRTPPANRSGVAP